MFRGETDPLAKFVSQNRLCRNGDFIYPRTDLSPELSFRQPIISSERRFRFIEQPVNPKGAELLSSPDFLSQHFADNGHTVVAPLPLINRGGTTLFVCAGVQILDPIIHQEAPIPSDPVFVAQPVLRTQFIDCVGEGTSTSFINVSTCQINVDQGEHFRCLQTWIDLFVRLGLNKDDFYFKTKPYEQQWGDRVVKGEKMFIVYDGLEIGDASYVPNLPQKNRTDLSLSDIGFGLERIKWIMQGGSYFEALGEGLVVTGIDEVAIACCHTLSLLAGEGLRPSNKSQGYRFRLFSKKLVTATLGVHPVVLEQIGSYYDYWKKWNNLPESKDWVLQAIAQENTRNFNRVLLNKLSEEYSDVGLDINQATAVILKRLKGTSVRPDHLIQTLNELQYQNEQ